MRLTIVNLISEIFGECEIHLKGERNSLSASEICILDASYGKNANAFLI